MEKFNREYFEKIWGLNLKTDYMRDLFPETFQDGKIDFEKLKGELGEEIDPSFERYGLSWFGKSDSKIISQAPPTGTLLPKKSRSLNWDKAKNVYIEGDNLEVLKLLQKSYHKKVKLIFIDPPYNTGKEFIYPDKYQDNLETYLHYTGQKDNEGNYFSANRELSGRYHTKWLNMMYPRLRLARNLLRDDGVLFASIDDHEVTNLRKLLDEVFGEENFVASIIWEHSVQPKGYQGIFSLHHNYVLCYSKTDKFTVGSLERTDEDNKNYSNPDNDPRGDWRTGDVRNALYRPNLIYDLETPNGNVISPPDNGWRWKRSTMMEKIQSGEIIFNADQTKIIRKIYLEDQDGRTPQTIWFAKDAGSTRDGAKEVKELYDGQLPFDTVKPTKLLGRIFDIAGLKENDIVLDFFSGSASTAHALEKFRPKSNYILVQLPEKLNDSTPHGKAAEQLGFETVSDIGADRISRVLRTTESESGFKFFSLSSSNLKSWDSSSDDLRGSLEKAMVNIKEDRSDEDLLYEILIKYGLSLTLPVEVREIQSKKIFVIGFGALIVCLEPEIDQALVEEICKIKDELRPEVTKVVFKDTGFKDDVVKTNAVLILNRHEITDVKSI